MARFNPDMDEGVWEPASRGETIAFWFKVAPFALPWLLLIWWLL
ncbi:MAG: hypothetical protein ABIS51_05795 [Sphingomonas sp.]